ncbi:HIT domain-containing protein [Candidatus Pacearchaeota archaeon]|nr:HIT domain-containing protein [Candidatus Pacearchaeota archaeon]
MLSKEDINLAKKQLNEQVEKMSDGAQKEAARQQLSGMSDETISSMVEQQRQPTGQAGSGGAREQRSVFRMIVSGDVPSKKVDENKEAIAVVSIRPVSKGHVIIIPRTLARDSKEIPSGAMSLAKKIASKMVSKLKASATEIQTSRAFDEVIVNVIPVYDKRVDVNSVAYEASEEELNEVHKSLRVVKTPKKEVIKVKKKTEKEEVIKLKRRVP